MKTLKDKVKCDLSKPFIIKNCFDYEDVEKAVLELETRSDMYHKELIKEILGDFKNK